MQYVQQKYIGETEQHLIEDAGHESNMIHNDNIVSRHYKEYNHTREDYTVSRL